MPCLRGQHEAAAAQKENKQNNNNKGHGVSDRCLRKARADEKWRGVELIAAGNVRNRQGFHVRRNLAPMQNGTADGNGRFRSEGSLKSHRRFA